MSNWVIIVPPHLSHLQNMGWLNRINFYLVALINTCMFWVVLSSLWSRCFEWLTVSSPVSFQDTALIILAAVKNHFSYTFLFESQWRSTLVYHHCTVFWEKQQPCAGIDLNGFERFFFLPVLFHFQATEVTERSRNACRYKMKCHTVASKEIWT